MIRRGECSYCKRTDVPLTRDHVVPRSRGGSDRKDNVVMACEPCNSFKGDRLLSELPVHWAEQVVLARLNSPRLTSAATRTLPAVSYADDWAARNIITEWERRTMRAEA